MVCNILCALWSDNVKAANLYVSVANVSFTFPDFPAIEMSPPTRRHGITVLQMGAASCKIYPPLQVSVRRDRARSRERDPLPRTQLLQDNPQRKVAYGGREGERGEWKGGRKRESILTVAILL